MSPCVSAFDIVEELDSLPPTAAVKQNPTNKYLTPDVISKPEWYNIASNINNSP
jgi:hypothetical protein